MNDSLTETILVTGGTGFLGKPLVRQLLADGHRVRCLTRSHASATALLEAVPDTHSHNRLEVVPGSLASVESCLTALEGCTHVIHAAAALTGSPAALFLNTVVSTRMLLRATREHGGIRRFVLVSSLAVYQTFTLRTGDLLDESCALESVPHLRDPYTFSKVEQEKLCWEAAGLDGLPLVVVRPGVVYGPGRSCLSNRCGLPLGNIFIQMGGRQHVPYTFVDNCAGAISRAISAPGIDGRAFNIIDDDLPTARQLIRDYRRSVRPMRVVMVPGWSIGTAAGLCEWISQKSNGLIPPVLTRYKAKSHWKRLRYSNRAAKTSLSWIPGVSTSDALRRTLSAEQGSSLKARP